MDFTGQQKQIPFAGFALIKIFNICLHSEILQLLFSGVQKKNQLDFNKMQIYFALAVLIKFYRLLFPSLISNYT